MRIMGKTLRPHQQRFVDKNPNRALLVWETQTGKTLAACEWLKLRTDRPALVLSPKAIIKKWERELADVNAVADVITHDAIKKMDISKYRAIVADECQAFASPLFTKQRSQRATKLYEHIRAHPDTHILLMSATPVRSSAWNIHTLACYLQHLWPVKQFRDKFEYLTDIYGRYHYEPVPDWRTKIRPYVKEIADIVLMKDIIDGDMPEESEEIINIPWTKTHEKAFKDSLAGAYSEPSAEWHARHRAEQGKDKLAKVKEITDGYQKAIVVCFYTEQIALYAREIGKERQVFVLQGSTKDQDAVIEAAKAADDCVFLIQASMGAGFSASEFNVVIFASMSFRYIDLVQMKGRVRVITDLHPNMFIYLLAGKCDRAVHERIMLGKDFDVHHELRKA